MSIYTPSTDIIAQIKEYCKQNILINCDKCFLDGECLYSPPYSYLAVIASHLKRDPWEMWYEEYCENTKKTNYWGDWGGDNPPLNLILQEISVSSKTKRECPNSTSYVIYKCQNCGKYLKVKVQCKKRTCEVCCKIRQDKLVEKYSPILKEIRWGVHMVLTGKHFEDLKEGIKWIRKKFKYLRLKYYPFLWGIYAIEAKPKPDGWYVHLHILANCRWISQKKISERWKQLTDCEVAFIRRVEPNMKALREVIKYVTEVWELEEWEKQLVEDEIKNVRLISTFGKKIELLQDTNIMLCEDCGSIMEPIAKYDEKTQKIIFFKTFLPP